MALTQMELIQSLGKTMAWFLQEIEWGVPATELRHLCGRIGELYVAMITNGQMATAPNQKGYDVVSDIGEHISVKTTAMMGSGGHIAFNANTLQLVDRVVVLRINTEEKRVETLLDALVSEVRSLMLPDGSIPLSPLIRKSPVRSDVKAVIEVSFQGYVIRELETGSIEVLRDGVPRLPVKPELVKIARILNVQLLYESGNPLNTRQLGSQIIKSIQELRAPEAQQGASPI